MKYCDTRYDFVLDSVSLITGGPRTFILVRASVGVSVLDFDFGPNKEACKN